jgi:hypothetical protein
LLFSFLQGSGWNQKVAHVSYWNLVEDWAVCWALMQAAEVVQEAQLGLGIPQVFEEPAIVY